MILDDLLILERRGWDSLCDGTGAEFYGDLMTEDAVMVLAHGVALGRDAVRASLAEAPTWDRYEIREERLVPAAENTATLVYTGHATRAGSPPFEALMASTYTRREGRWRLTVYQQTPIPQPADEQS